MLPYFLPNFIKYECYKVGERVYNKTHPGIVLVKYFLPLCFFFSLYLVLEASAAYWPCDFMQIAQLKTHQWNGPPRTKCNYTCTELAASIPGVRIYMFITGVHMCSITHELGLNSSIYSFIHSNRWPIALVYNSLCYIQETQRIMTPPLPSKGVRSISFLSFF